MKMFWTSKFVLVVVLSCVFSLYPGGFCETTPAEISKNQTDAQPKLPQIEEPQPVAESELDEDAERLKRAQGPITELYGCLITLFLNPLCWNKFENNRLRYLQYLYLRRKLQMMEAGMKMNQTMHAGPAAPQHGMSNKPRGSAAPMAHATHLGPGAHAPGAPPTHPESDSDQPKSRIALVKQRLFPRSYATMKELQKRARGLKQLVMTQAQQLFMMGVAQAQQVLKKLPQAQAKVQAKPQHPPMMTKS